MPRVSRKRKSSRRTGSKKMFPATSSRKRKSSRRSKVKIHTFNGTINGGILSVPAASTAITTWGGVYTLDMSVLPIFASLSDAFEFGRLNSLRFELLPRNNVTTIATNSGSTIVVGVDEIPMTTSSGTASTWGAATSEDSGVTEARAQYMVNITPDYVRGLEGSVECELYQKIVKKFVPAWYVQQSQAPNNFNSSSGLAATYEPKKRCWFAINLTTSTAGATASPVYWGLMYAFCATAASVQTPAYDVRIHYSVSFKRIRGV